MRKLLSLLTIGLILSHALLAQEAVKPKSYFGIKAGLNFSKFKVDPTIVNTKVDYKTGFAGGVFYNIPFSKSFSLQPELLYSIMGPQVSYEQTQVVIDKGDLNLNYISVPILFKFNVNERIAFVLGPQVDLLMSAKSKLDFAGEEDIKDNFKSTDFAGTGGIELWPAYNLMIYGRYIYGLVDINSDNTITSKLNNQGFQVGLGWGFRKKAKAPVVAPPPPPVADTDGDGILDPDDKCPNQAGLAKYGGCPIPDTDGDGVNDEQDKCPNQAGLAKYNGCPIPDTDGDGINDEQDKCPNEAGVAEYQGCPVPDRDKDGVADDRDKCPDVAGVPEKDGCPDLKAEFNFEFRMVQFVTGSSKLTPTAQKELNKLVDALNKYPTLGVNVDGHTDNVGKAEFNLKLSQARADAVKNYLVKKGIAADRLTATGHGLDNPIGDNATKEGRAANRRVEFSLRQ